MDGVAANVMFWLALENASKGNLTSRHMRLR